ncbi:MAG: hypothetical protein GY756_21385 [bacterium]|nr:hypothetical protein [bacterium]
MALLYRGVSKEKDDKLSGKLEPKGNNSEITAKHDGKIKPDRTFTYGKTENNTVRAHQIETGLYDGCFVSTTKNEKMAVHFATSNGKETGWVYIIDSDLFEKYGVISKEFSDPLYPGEKEVTIRAEDCDAIPEEVIVEKYEVNINGKRKT